MPDGFERLRNLQLRSRIVKEPEKVSSPTQSSTYQALISPSAKLDSGVKDLANNPLQGMLKIGLGIAEAGFLPVSLPFAIADDVVGGKEEGEHNVFSRINQGLQGVMHLPANLVEGGTHLINEGMKALGVDTKKVDDAIMFELQRRGLMSWTANPEELAETINEVNQMAATLLAFKGAHNLGKTIRGEKVTKQDLAKLRTDRTDIGLPKSEPKQLGAPKGDFAKIEVDPMGRTRTVPKGENTQAYTKLELFRDELAGKKESLIKERDALKQRAFDKNLTKEQRSDASKRLKEIKPELDEISKRLSLIEKELQSKRGEVEFKDLPETKLLPEKRIEPIPTENVPSNINFSVATEPGAKTITKMGTEKVLPVKRVTEKTDVKPDVKPVDKVQEPTGKIELRTDKNGKDYYYNTETKKRTSKEEFEKQRPKEIDQYTPEDIALGQAPTPLVIREAQQIKGKNFEKDFETFKNKPENKKRLDESPDKIRTESALIEEYAQGIVAESKGGKPFDIKSRVEDAVKKSEPEKLTIGKSEGTTPLFQQSKEVKGQGNIFKSETLERLRQEAKNELNNTNIGANPQLFMKSVQIGAIHFKNGITKFADWSKQMIKDLGEKVKPRLLSIWNEIKKFGEDLGKIAVDKIGEFVESKYNPARPLKMIDQSLFERPKSKQEIKTQREFSDVYKDIKKTSPEELAKNREVFKKRHSVIERGREALRKDMESFKSFVREKGVPLDTRLFQISPKIYQYVKQGEFELKNRIIKADDVVVKFTEPLSKLPIEVRADLDILLKNRELDAAYKIFDRYGLRKEFDNVRKLMDDLGTELGVGKIRDYFPRMVKDYEGLLKEFKGSEFWNTFERLIREKEKKIGRELTIEEQATLINNAIRGYNPGIRLSNIGAMRERIIPKLDAELSRYYHDFDAAVTAYVGQSIEHTAALKFFGKQKVDIPAITNESIGKLIAEKMLDTDKILNPKQVQEVTNILKAAYQGKGTTGWASTVKNVTYLTRLFNWFGAMIQLGDLAMPIYRSPLETPKAFAKALGERVGLKPKEKIKLKDIGVDLDRIAQEIVDPSKRSKVMNWATKYSLFKAIDAIGKDTYINALYNKYHRLAKNGKLKEGHPDYWRFKETFGEKANEVIAEFGRKEFTPRTAFQLFNELDKTQPYTKWSLPEGYHTSGQAQLFYQFKTFMIRRLDFVLNESVRQFTNKELPKKQRIEAAGRLARVLMSVSLAEGGIDSAREFLKTGQMPQLDEVVADNLLRLVLLSKYDVTRLKRDGLGSMIANKVFPSLGVFSDAGSDLVSLFGTDPKFRTLRNVPVMGEALYSWMRSATKKSTRRNTR